MRMWLEMNKPPNEAANCMRTRVPPFHVDSKQLQKPKGGEITGQNSGQINKS